MNFDNVTLLRLEVFAVVTVKIVILRHMTLYTLVAFMKVSVERVLLS
jgi:hypothetical protein